VLTDDEIAQGLSLGQATLDALGSNQPADLYEFVGIPHRIADYGTKLGVQGVLWPMRLSRPRQGNVAGGIIPAGTMWADSSRGDH
jgi:hypothetical protein